MHACILLRKSIECLKEEYLQLISRQDLDEQMLQNFLERHYFLLSPRRKVEKMKRKLGPYIPDFILRYEDNTFTLVEIQLNRDAIVQNSQPSPGMKEAIGQLNDWFEWIDSNEHSMLSKYSGLIVIGRRESYNKNKNCMHAKNLVKVESRIEKQAAGATTTKPIEADVKGKIIEFAWWMNKEGYAETTIRLYTTVIKVLTDRGANVFNPDSVKEVMAKQNWSEARRHCVIAAYTLFLKMLGRTWNPPICKVTRKLPFIPTEQEINALIAGCGNKTATFLQLLKETGMRAGEANGLKWTNIDFERRTMTLNNPEKGGNARIFNVSSKLIGMLNALPKTSLRIFGEGPTSFRKSAFYQTRKVLAKKLQNPRLQRISFHTLRHWKATMLYHQTKDILYVKQFLGHRKVETTLLYIQLAEAIFKDTTDEFTVRVASKPNEIKDLLEVGFEFICENDGLLYFRKRK